MNEMNASTRTGIVNIRVTDITPEYAEEILKLNTSNRPIKRTRVDMYAADMMSNRWQSNGVPIVIGTDNILKDGQHRLAACIKAKSTIKDAIIIRIPCEQSTCYDIGVARTVKDTASLMNKKDDIFKSAKTMGTLRYAIVAAMPSTRADSTLSKSFIIDEASKNKSALSFIHRYLNGNNKIQGITVAPVWAVILNAYNSGYPYEKLEHFCDVLVSGMTEDKKDFPIIWLRNFLLSAKAGTGTRCSSKDKFLRTQNCLHKYELGIDTSMCRASKEIFYKYQLPEEI